MSEDAFPGDPGSLSLGLDADVVFAGRLQAQREFARVKLCTPADIVGVSEDWRYIGPVHWGPVAGRRRSSLPNARFVDSHNHPITIARGAIRNYLVRIGKPGTPPPFRLG
jgi:hypothetical protein